MKGRILNILRTEHDVVSGEILSAHLGISRVSVWKHLKKLRELGYHIEATPKGYRLLDDPDFLYPWEFEESPTKIHYFDEVDSTMDIARELARNGCPHFTVVIAGRQKKGRGRLKRTWLSPEGGLYFTVIVRPDIPPALSSRVNFAASTVLAQILRNHYDIHAKVKWPNDVLVDGRKISGILSEMEAEIDRVGFISIGVGINVNNDPTSHEPSAISVKQLLGRQILRKELLAAFLNRFQHALDNGNLEQAVSQWKRYAETLNRYVRVATTHETSEGFAVDVDDNGALILKLADGSLKRIIYGDCFHKKGNR